MIKKIKNQLKEKRDERLLNWIQENLEKTMNTTEKDRRYIAMINGDKVPCTLCRYAPPTVDTDKPCKYCPAQGQEKEKE